MFIFLLFLLLLVFLFLLTAFLLLQVPQNIYIRVGQNIWQQRQFIIISKY